MEYNIVQMFAAASYGGTDPSGPIFNDSAAQIRLNLSNSLGYVDFKGIGDCGLLAWACDFRKPHTKKSSGVKSHDLGAQFTHLHAR